MASGSAGSIYVDLLLRDANYRQGLNRARQRTSTTTQAIKSSVKSLAATFAAGFSATEIIKYSDTWKQLQGRLSLVVSETQSLTAVQDDLANIAERTRQPLEGVYNLYTRISQAIPEAQRAQYDLLGVTESINAALAITGEGSAQAASAILQFSQALQSDFKGSAQEINSLLDSAPRLAQAIQRAFGDGSKSLKQLAADGELSTDAILRALSGTGEEGRRLREEFAKIPPTVGQAFTELNNKILEYVGNNSKVTAASDAIGTSIRAVANNLDLAVDAAVLLSGVMVSRLIPSIASSTVSFVAATQQSIAYQAALARMAGISRIAAVSITGLSGALALVGGPIGAAFLAAGAAVYYFANELSTADEIAQKYPDTFRRISEETGKAVENQRAYNEALNVAKLNEYNRSLEDANRLFTEINNQLRTGAGGYGSFFDQFMAFGSDFSKELYQVRQAFAQSKIDVDQYALALELLEEKYPEQWARNILSDVREQIAAFRTAKTELDSLTGGVYGPTPPAGGLSSPAPAQESEKDRKKRESEAKKRQQELNRAYEQYEHLIRGVSKEVVNLERVERELDELRKAGSISQDEMTAALERYEAELKKTGKEMDQYAKTAAENIQGAFADFLFDPFEKGLDGMLESFGKTIMRMLAEAQAAQLARALFGNLVEGGEGGGLLGGFARDIFGSFAGGFANGGTIPSGQWGIVGERGPELAFGGNTGQTIIPGGKIGGGISVNIINNNGSNVRTAPGTNGADLDVLIDEAVARKMSQSGSQINQAMGAYNSRGLVKR